MFSNVYFINGTGYAGKSTIAKLLAEKHDGIVTAVEKNPKDSFQSSAAVERSGPSARWLKTVYIPLFNCVYYILCEENYHDRLLPQLSKEEFPCLTYTRDLEDWHDFIRRTPEDYAAWVDGVTKECEILELRILKELCTQGKPVFVDTNISTGTLKTITDHGHVLIMLADPQISAQRFFERPDKEKQFLYQLIMEEPDPEYALNNFRQCLARINSQENYDHFLHSGFHVILRDEARSIQQTLALAEKAFGLGC